MHGKAAKKECFRWEAGQVSRRSECTRTHPGLGFRSSRHRKLERKRVAEAGTRREHRMQEGKWNQLRPEDFGGRALRRANWMSPRVDRRSSANRSSCGRRTSLGLARLSGTTATAALPISIAFM